jgi:hypothetical protein
MATIAAACIAVLGAAKKSKDEKDSADAASAQAMATHAQNQAAMIARAYAGSIRMTTADPSMMFDAARGGGMITGTGGGMGGGGLGNQAISGQSGAGMA